VFDFFHDVAELAKAGNANAKAVMQSWADAEWFTSRPEVPASQKLTVFKVTGETNTDDLSPAPDAWSRPDIPLHALAMLKNPRPGIEADEPGVRGPIKQLEALAAKGNLIAYVGDVVGTGSSRKSATNSVLWFTGEDIPFVPNKRFGGVCLGSKIAPIFFNTMEDAGALPIESIAAQMDMGDEIELKVDAGHRQGHRAEERRRDRRIATEDPGDHGRSPRRRPYPADHRPWPDHQGPRIPRPAAKRRCSACRKTRPTTARATRWPRRWSASACGVPEGGILPGTYCEPKMTTVGSQGHHRPDDPRRTEGSGLPRLLRRPGDAVLLPHRRLSEAGRRQDAPRTAVLHQHPWRRCAASGRRRHPLLAEPPAAAGYRRYRRRLAHPFPDRHLLPGRFRSGRLCRRHRRHAAGHAGIRAGPLQGQDAGRITLRDLVNAIPLYAIKAGLLTVEKKGKKNVFSGRILEIEGLPILKVEQAFELSDASAERSAAACAVALNKEPIVEYMRSNITLMKWMIAEGYAMPAP
jgi:aconitate hydratase 2/2-methylisocitrate dehydratase